MNQPSTAGQRSDKKTFSPRMMWGMWLCATLFYCYENILQVSPSVMIHDWMRDFHLNAAHIGMLGAYYFYAYSSIQLPVGILLDRFGARRLLTGATLLCASGCFLIASAHHVALAQMGRFLIGLGSGCAAIGCLHIAATSLAPTRFALLTGLTLTMGMIGSITGEVPMAFLLKTMHWRGVLNLMALLGCIIALLIWLVVRDIRMPGIATPQTKPSQENFLSGLAAVMRNPQNWIISLYGSLLFTPIITFGGLWGVSFLMRDLHIQRPLAASINSSIFIGFAIGAPLFGWFSDAIKRRKPPLVLAAFGSLMCLTALLYGQHLSSYEAAALLFGFGFFSSSFLPSFSMMRENNVSKHNATSLGFMNTFNMILPALAQPLVGILMDAHWHHLMMHGRRIYQINNYQNSLSVLAIGLAVALLLLPFIKETGTTCENLY